MFGPLKVNAFKNHHCLDILDEMERICESATIITSNDEWEYARVCYLQCNPGLKEGTFLVKMLTLKGILKIPVSWHHSWLLMVGLRSQCLNHHTILFAAIVVVFCKTQDDSVMMENVHSYILHNSMSRYVFL